MEKGHFGQYTGNAGHSRTPVTKRNYRASVADDAAHIHYLEEDMKYDKKHHGSPAKQVDERSGEKPLQTYKGSEFDPDVPVEDEVVVTGERQGPSGEVVVINGVEYRKIGGNLYPKK